MNKLTGPFWQRRQWLHFHQIDQRLQHYEKATKHRLMAFVIERDLGVDVSMVELEQLDQMVLQRCQRHQGIPKTSFDDQSIWLTDERSQLKDLVQYDHLKKQYADTSYRLKRDYLKLGHELKIDGKKLLDQILELDRLSNAELLAS